MNTWRAAGRLVSRLTGPIVPMISSFCNFTGECLKGTIIVQVWLPELSEDGDMVLRTKACNSPGLLLSCKSNILQFRGMLSWFACV